MRQGTREQGRPSLWPSLGRVVIFTAISAQAGISGATQRELLRPPESVGYKTQQHDTKPQSHRKGLTAYAYPNYGFAAIVGALAIIAISAVSASPQAPVEAHEDSVTPGVTGILWNNGVGFPTCFAVYPTNAAPADVLSPVFHAA